MKTPFRLNDDERQDFVSNDEYLYSLQRRSRLGRRAWIRANRDDIDAAYDRMLNPCDACNAMPDQTGCIKHR
jgi:hypothetical protein